MIAARCGLLLVAAMLVLFGFQTAAPDLSPSAWRVVVAAVVGLLAPLFWPGNAPSPARTALRIVAWSAAAACLAAVALRFIGHAPQPFSRILGVCMMLLPILLATHTLTALLEWQWRVRTGHAETAREMAGRTASLALAALSSLPLWFGPVAESLSHRQDWIVDTALGVSPLTHLAVASGNDLLRNEWLYQHSNLASLQVSYPDLATAAWFYASVCLLLAIGALAFWRLRGTERAHAHPNLEKPR